MLVTGNIPLEGTIRTCIKCDSNLCIVSLTSSLRNEIRLLRFASTHVLSNYLSTQVQVMCFAMPDTTKVWDFPKLPENHCFSVAPHSPKRLVIRKNAKKKWEICAFICTTCNKNMHLSMQNMCMTQEHLLYHSPNILKSSILLKLLCWRSQHQRKWFISFINGAKKRGKIQNENVDIWNGNI